VLTACSRKRWIVMAGLRAGRLVQCGVAEVAEIGAGADRGPRCHLGVFVGPEGATLDYTDKYARQIEGIYANTKDVERFFVVSGNPTVSQGISFVGLTDWKERDRNSATLWSRNCSPNSWASRASSPFRFAPPSLGQSPRERPVNFVVVTSASYAELAQMTGRFSTRWQRTPASPTSIPTSS
jgi:multidrug efflux pump